MPQLDVPPEKAERRMNDAMRKALSTLTQPKMSQKPAKVKPQQVKTTPKGRA